jgi:hypothetical protein
MQPDNNFIEIRPSASLLERAQRLWALNSVASKIRDHEKIQGTKLENDARAINELIRQHSVLLTIYHRCGNDPNLGMELLSLSDINKIPSTTRNMTNLGRLQFVVMLNFFIESILRKFIRRNSASPEFGYTKVARQALNLAEIYNKSDEYAMMVISMIRNTFHDAGTHSHNTKTLSLQGVSYSFVQGDYVKGDAGWDQIAHAANCALKVIEKIVSTLP